MSDPLGGLAPPEGSAPGPQAPAAGTPRRPPAISTTILVALLLAAFAAEGALTHWTSFQDEEALLRLGALFTPAINAGDWWRIGSYAFLHIGWVHLIVNLASLFSLMRWIEAAYGSAAAIGLFSASAIAGGALSTAFRLGAGSAGIAAGASGGIFGLLGAWIALWIRLRHRVPKAVFRAQVRAFLVTLGINAMIAFQFPVDNFAHAGGLVAGFLLGLLAPLPIAGPRPWSQFARASLLLSAVALAAAEGAALARAVHPMTRRFSTPAAEATLPWFLAPYSSTLAISAGGELQVSIDKWEAVEPVGEVVTLGDRRWRLWQQSREGDDEAQCLQATQLVSQDDDKLHVRVCCTRKTCVGARSQTVGEQIAASAHARN